MATKSVKRLKKKKLNNGAVLHCIASNGINSLNIFESNNKLVFKWYRGNYLCKDSICFSIKNGRLNIYETSYINGSKTFRNITRKFEITANIINKLIKDCNYSGVSYEPSIQKDDIPF